jgi:polyisoprenyl-phosphate glycosyltransferase
VAGFFGGLRVCVRYRNPVVYFDRQEKAGGEAKLSFISRLKYAMDVIQA